ncbi:MAG: PAS domain S-box protein [Nitrospirae bacterium]|nr:PAS domain S-box protein [Nitrospirota bacterium]
MQRRRSERIPLNLPAQILLGGKIYDGFIINVSKDGIGSAVTSVVEAPAGFVPVNHVELHFQDPFGKNIDLACELAWFSRSDSDSRKITIGMRIINPPLMYKVFIRTLLDANLQKKSKEQLIAELLEARRKIGLMKAAGPKENRPDDILVKREDVYHSLVESTEDSIYIVDRECRYQFMNQMHLSRLGLSSDECLGLPYRDLHSAEESDEFLRNIEAVFATGTSLRYEQQSSKDGKYFLRSLSPIRGADNSIKAVTVISKNITDRKLAEELLMNSNQELERQVRDRTSALVDLNESLNREIAERRQTEDALKKSSEEWRITFDSTKDMMLMLDEAFNVIRLNRATATFLDRPYRKIIGLSIFELFPNMDIKPERHPLRKMARSKRHEESEIYSKDKGIWVLASADPIVGNDGTMTGAVHIIRDITEQKNLQLQLLQAQKMESIGRLAGGIAHDFNNLLSAIIGYTELTLLKLPAESPLKDHLVTVKDAGEKAAELTHRLLAFSRKQVLQMQAVNLSASLESMVKMMSRMVREDISLELHTGPSLNTIMADPVQIEQIVMNLIVNARDSMPNGGKLIIETSNAYLDDDFVVRHENVERGNYVLLSVSDTGIGMSKKVQERIFEPFFTTKGMSEGTGLGLATVYGIVKQHNGYIYVYSEIGKGTTFKIYLPVSGEERAALPEKAYEVLAGGSEVVLVVDDDPSIRKLIKDVLEPLGYRLLFANDGDEALHTAQQATEPIEVLLTDVIMPNMNGSQLADIFRRDYPGVKVIFMSGYTDETITRQGVLTEGDILIQKPLSPTKLTNRLREILDKRSNS